MAGGNTVLDKILGILVMRQSGRNEIDVMRQTVLSGRLDASRIPNFLTGVGGSQATIVATVADPLVLSFAGGFDDDGQLDYKARVTSNGTVGSLAADTTYYIYAEQDPDSLAITFGKNAVRPVVVGELPEGAGVSQGDLGACLTSAHAALPAASGTVSAVTAHPSYPAWWSFTGEPQPTSRNYNGCILRPGAWQLTYQFASAQTVQAYAIGLQCSKWGVRYRYSYPNSWTLKASNTGAFAGEEVTLDTQAAVTAPTQRYGRSDFTIGSPGAYTYYRFDFTKRGPGSGWTSGYLRLGQITLTGAAAIPASGDQYNTMTGVMVDGDLDEVRRVYLGEIVTDDSGDISSATAYALRGEYQSGWEDLALSGVTTFSHNLGVVPGRVRGQLWVPGADHVQPILTAGSATTSVQHGTVLANLGRLSVAVHGGATSLWVPGPTQGSPVTRGKVRVFVERG